MNGTQPMSDTPQNPIGQTSPTASGASSVAPGSQANAHPTTVDAEQALLARWNDAGPDAGTDPGAGDGGTAVLPQAAATPSDAPAGEVDPETDPEAEHNGIDIPVDGEDADPEAYGDELDPEADPDAEPGQDGDAWPDSAKKRIAKVTAQKKDLIEQLRQRDEEVQMLRTELTERIENARHEPPSEANPLINVTDPAKLEQMRVNAKEALDWCIKNPYGGEVPGAKDEHGQPLVLTPDEAAERRIELEHLLSTQIPERKEWLRSYQQASQEAYRHYPQLFKPGPQSDAAWKILEKYPTLQAHPDYLALVGDILIGQSVREGRAVIVRREKPATDAGSPAVPKRHKAPTVPRPGAGVPRPGTNAKGTQQEAAAMAQFLSSGSASDAARVLESRLG